LNNHLINSCSSKKKKKNLQYLLQHTKVALNLSPTMTNHLSKVT